MSPTVQIDKPISNHAIILLKEIKRYENRLLKKSENPSNNHNQFDTVGSESPLIVSSSFKLN